MPVTALKGVGCATGGLVDANVFTLLFKGSLIVNWLAASKADDRVGNGSHARPACASSPGSAETSCCSRIATALPPGVDGALVFPPPRAGPLQLPKRAQVRQPGGIPAGAMAFSDSFPRPGCARLASMSPPEAEISRFRAAIRRDLLDEAGERVCQIVGCTWLALKLAHGCSGRQG